MQINKHHGYENVVSACMRPKYIVVHYTAGGPNVANAGTAESLCKYFASANRNASANYFIDNGGIWEYADPDQYYTWHCGDGNGRNGITNQNSVGIEVCAPDYSENPYTDAEVAHLRDLVTWLMARYGIDANHVVRHYDASGKGCPWYYTKYGKGGDAAWAELKKVITGGASPSEDIEEDEMICIFQPNDMGCLVFYDGHEVHTLHHPDEAEAIREVYRKTHNGKNIPEFKFGEERAPWASRFIDATRHGLPNYQHLIDKPGDK